MCTARYKQCVLVRELLGMRIARYWVIPKFWPHIKRYGAVSSGNADRYVPLDTSVPFGIADLGRYTSVVQVDPFLSVSSAHDIGESVRHQIHRCHNQVAEVFIHIEFQMHNIGNWFQQMSLERVTLHSLQGKLLVLAQVSMPAELLIR
ncbi:hypothetical protein BHM03_00032999 [Ensete ventricosum]|nr:hypothetical protein BHM03_00032999 [Ensete ventricosum]